MSMSIDIGEDADELDDDRDERDDDDDDEDGGDRSSRKTGRRPTQRKDSDSEDDEGDDSDLDDLDEDALRAELKKARKKLATAGKQTARQRAARKELADRIKQIEGNLDEDDDEDDDGKPKRRSDEKGLDARAVQKTVSKAVRDRERALAEEHRRDLIDARAESALERAGVSPKNVRLLKRELDYDEIDFDPKKRTIDGLDEEIDRLKDDFPDLFRRPKMDRRRISGGDDRSRGDRKGRALSATELQARQLRGR